MFCLLLDGGTRSDSGQLLRLILRSGGLVRWKLHRWYCLSGRCATASQHCPRVADLVQHFVDGFFCFCWLKVRTAKSEIFLKQNWGNCIGHNEMVAVPACIIWLQVWLPSIKGISISLLFNQATGKQWSQLCQTIRLGGDAPSRSSPSQNLNLPQIRVQTWDAADSFTRPSLSDLAHEHKHLHPKLTELERACVSRNAAWGTVS